MRQEELNWTQKACSKLRLLRPSSLKLQLQLPDPLALILRAGSDPLLEGLDFSRKMANDLTLGLDLVALRTNDPALLLEKLGDLCEGGLDRAHGRGSGSGSRELCGGGGSRSGRVGGPDGRGKLLDWRLEGLRGRRLVVGRSGDRCSHGSRGSGSGSRARNLFERRGLAFAWLGIFLILELVRNSGHGGLLVRHARWGRAGSRWGRGLPLGHGGWGRRRDDTGGGRLVVGGDLLGRSTLVDALHVDLGGEAILAVEPLLGGHSGLKAGRRGVDIGLEGLGATRNGERDGLDVLIVDGLVGPHDFVLVDVDTTARHESDASLGVAGLVLGEELQLVVLILEITDVAITANVSILKHVYLGLRQHLPLASKVQAVRAVIYRTTVSFGA